MAIEKLMAGAAGDVQIGIIVKEASTGKVVYSRDADLPLNPASNTKVLSTLAALSSLGPNYTFKTQFLGLEAGKKEKGRLRNLTLKGFGDPLLSSDHLETMAAQLKEKGVREIESLSVDGSHFDDGDFPGQMQGRQRDASFNCSVGALSVDHNLLFLNISPGETVGSPALIEIDPPLAGFPVEGEVLTQRRKGRIVLKNQNGDETDLGVQINGSIALKSEPLRYRISIQQPLHLAAMRLRDALSAQGILLPSETRFDPAPAKSKVLVEHRSLPLSLILQEINKRSDNFMAEQLTKALGAESEGAPGTTAKGVKTILKQLSMLGVATSSVDIENGSGLSKVNRFSAKTLAQALQVAYVDPALRQNFLSSLSVLGVDGTLRRKFRRSDLAGRFFGKTGTLNGVSSLSGYVFPKNSESEAFVYAFIVNGKGKNFWKEKQRGQAILETLLNW
ncbi:MAG TPA: D-alanyl-D-alanine carboxypeptidase/D-alanyl-D-alanine-endopeptidase [bacterium]|nr:D-alanyl-D-alanine carboxypeptidase/D-alanyl-D-alanine-endopeptidase [bacterium]